jgi:quercetin dioxygenase-like cupin family protein
MIIRSTDPEKCDPLDMEGIKGVSMRVMVGREDGAPNFAMRHFILDPGGFTPHHSHDYEHQVVVLKGRGEAFDAGETREISAGDVILVESDAEHQFRNTGEEPLQFLCLVPLHGRCGEAVPGS